MDSENVHEPDRASRIRILETEPRNGEDAEFQFVVLPESFDANPVCVEGRATNDGSYLTSLWELRLETDASDNPIDNLETAR